MRSQNTAVFDPGISVALDFARFTLALCVAAAHWTQAYFQDGWPDITRLAVAAVGGFFILSGFTIRMITAGTPFQLENYLFKRLARLWSVVLPALLLTVLLDSVSAHTNPAYYLSNWRQDEPLLGLLANLAFVTQLWGTSISPLSNSPFWSIGYEAWFYLLYGLALARRPVLMVLAAFVAGPNILFLMVLWLAGIGIYELVARANTRSKQVVLLMAGGILCAATYWLLGTRGMAAHHLYDALLSAYFQVFHVSPARIGLGFSLVAGALVFGVLMLVVLPALKLARPRLSSTTVRIGRALGEFTFPLYLLHFPLFVLCGAVGFYDRHSAIQKVGVFAALCVLIFAVAPATSAFKLWLQNALPVAWASLRRTASTQPT